MYRWLQITLTNQTKIDFPWISFIHLHFFCFPSYYFYMGKFTLDNSNHALSIWKVQKKFAAVVRNIVFILTTMYSLSLLFCQSSFKTESSTVCLYQALKCACCLYSFSTPLSGYLPWPPANSNLFRLPWPPANSNLFRLQETIRLTITWIWSIILAIGRILVKHPPPRALTCISCSVFQKRAWQSGQHIGLAIRWSRIRVLLSPLAGFILS